MSAIKPRTCIVFWRWSVDLLVRIKLTPLGVANVGSREFPRDPVRDVLRCVPTSGELVTQHQAIVRIAAGGCGRIAEGKVRGQQFRISALFRGCAAFRAGFAGGATGQESQ